MSVETSHKMPIWNDEQQAVDLLVVLKNVTCAHLLGKLDADIYARERSRVLEELRRVRNAH